MKVTEDLKGARLTIVLAAELVKMHPGHFRRLCQRGVFPQPKRTAKGRPYFDYELLSVIANVLKSGVGKNGEEIVFYRRRATNGVTKQSARRPEMPTASKPSVSSMRRWRLAPTCTLSSCPSATAAGSASQPVSC